MSLRICQRQSQEIFRKVLDAHNEGKPGLKILYQLVVGGHALTTLLLGQGNVKAVVHAARNDLRRDFECPGRAVWKRRKMTGRVVSRSANWHGHRIC